MGVIIAGHPAFRHRQDADKDGYLSEVQPDRKIWFSMPRGGQAASLRIRGMGWRERMPAAFTHRPAGTGDYFYVLFYDGIRLRDDGGLCEWREPVAILWEPGRPHYYGSNTRPYLHSWIHFSGTLCPPVVAGIGLTLNRAIPVRETVPFERMLTDLHEEVTAAPLSSPEILLNILDIGMRRMVRAAGSARAAEPPAGLKQAKSLIESAPEKPWTAAELARRAGYSRQHFSDLFRRHYACPPVSYLNRVRMELAAHLLTEPNRRVAETARAVGFEDPYHFSRAFRRFHGLSPRQWRDGIRAHREV
jgi:AraC-like DNA-binding protein